MSAGSADISSFSSPVLGSNVKMTWTNAYRNSVTYSKHELNWLGVGSIATGQLLGGQLGVALGHSKRGPGEKKVATHRVHSNLKQQSQPNLCICFVLAIQVENNYAGLQHTVKWDMPLVKGTMGMKLDCVVHSFSEYSYHITVTLSIQWPEL